MHRIIATILAILILAIAAKSQTIIWEKSLGGTKDDYGYKIKKTTDNGFIVIGSSESTNGDVGGNNGSNGTQDIWVVKLDEEGNIDWEKNSGGSEDEFGRSIEQTFDGGFILTGATESNDGDVGSNNGSRDFWVVKIDSMGTIEWEKTFGGDDWDFPEAIKQTSDSGYIVLGITYFSLSAKLDYQVFKLDANGNIEWQKRYGGSEDEYSTAIELTNDQGYILAGRSKSNDDDVSGNYGDYDFWVVKLNQNGDIQWERNYGGSEQEIANSIVQTLDGGYIIAGSSKSSDFDLDNNYGEFDAWVLKIDSEGNVEWEKNYGGSDYDSASSINLTQDNGYIVAGTSESNDYDLDANNGKGDYWIFKIDENGNILWDKNLGGTNYEIGISADVVDQDNFVITGQCSSSDGDVSDHKGMNDLWVVKVRGNLTNLSENKPTTQIEIFPNPFSDNLQITSSDPTKQYDILVFNEWGSLIKKEKLTNGGISLHEVPSGIYVVQILTEEGILLEKVIKM